MTAQTTVPSPVAWLPQAYDSLDTTPKPEKAKVPSVGSCRTAGRELSSATAIASLAPWSSSRNRGALRVWVRTLRTSSVAMVSAASMYSAAVPCAQRLADHFACDSLAGRMPRKIPRGPQAVRISLSRRCSM
jgi:hypothetical protein